MHRLRFRPLGVLEAAKLLDVSIERGEFGIRILGIRVQFFYCFRSFSLLQQDTLRNLGRRRKLL